MVSQVHDVETRHRTLSVSLPSTGRNGSKAFKFNGIKSWNKLPLKMEKLNSLASFKQASRLYLIDRLVREYNSDFYISSLSELYVIFSIIIYIKA